MVGYYYLFLTCELSLPNLTREKTSTETCIMRQGSMFLVFILFQEAEWTTLIWTFKEQKWSWFLPFAQSVQVLLRNSLAEDTHIWETPKDFETLASKY